MLVEWLNVSGGIDAPAVWMMAHREMIRAGYGYVAVSAQRVGIEGGANMMGIDMSLKSQDPERYSSLHHPGDAYSYAMSSQAGRLVRDGQRNDILRGLRAEHVIAVGESQSALFLTTYINAVDPLAQAYDGFRVHLRFGPAAPLDGGSIFDASESNISQAVAFRPDLRVPSSPSSPKPIFSVGHDRATTARDSLTINGFGFGRSPERLMPTTTRSKSHRSTPGPRH